MTEPITLNNGLTMPPIGLGVFQSAPDDTAKAVEAALRAGYRHIDTAATYQNEREVGAGIRASGLDRDDVFIGTKVWVTEFGFDETLHAFDKSARKLGVDRIDLLLLHQPMPQRFERTVAAYQALEQLLERGQVGAIGISNFMPQHLDDLLEQVDVVPAVNQIELHPYFTQADVQRANAGHGIVTQAWSPIGGITSYPRRGKERTNVLDDPEIRAIAKLYDKTPAQVVLRWHLQQGRSVIPKSTNPARITENFDVFDFILTSDELARLDDLNTGVRGGDSPDEVDPMRWDIHIPEA